MDDQDPAPHGVSGKSKSNKQRGKSRDAPLPSIRRNECSGTVLANGIESERAVVRLRFIFPLASKATLRDGSFSLHR
jgi:hypothetical protein